MTRTFTEDFETGPDGASLTLSNTAFDSYNAGTGATRTFDAANALLGSFAGKYAVGATSGTVFGNHQIGSTANVRFFRFYIKAGTVSGSQQLVAARLATANAGLLRLSALNKFVITSSGTAIYTSTMTSTGAWIRVEWMIDATNNKARLRLFTGPNLHGVTPDEDSGDVAYSGGALDNYRLGIQTSVSNLTIYFDSFAVDDATWVGPAVSITGALGGTLPALSAAGSVSVQADGSLAAPLPPLSGSATGSVRVDPNLSGALPPMSGSVTVETVAGATVAGTLPLMTGSSVGSVVADASVAGSLPALSGSAAASVVGSGLMAGALPPLIGVVEGDVGVTGSLTASVAAITASADAEVPIEGSLGAATLGELVFFEAEVIVAAAFESLLPILSGQIGAWSFIERPIPPERTLRVAVEHRVRSVPAEDRTYTVPAEYRTLVV